MSNGKTVGYIRVSTLDQNLDRQLEGIKLDKVFRDKASGKDVRGGPHLLDSLAAELSYSHVMLRC